MDGKVSRLEDLAGPNVLVYMYAFTCMVLWQANFVWAKRHAEGMGQDWWGPAWAGGWPGARGRDVLRGGVWRHDAEGGLGGNPG